MISGLALIKDLSGCEWMSRAIGDVQEIIKTLLGKELKIQVVHNASGRHDAEARYCVRMVPLGFSGDQVQVWLFLQRRT